MLSDGAVRGSPTGVFPTFLVFLKFSMVLERCFSKLFGVTSRHSREYLDDFFTVCICRCFLLWAMDAKPQTTGVAKSMDSDSVRKNPWFVLDR